MVDFGLTFKDYAQHRQGFPQEFFENLNVNNIGKENQKILDIGTGTGTIARGLAMRRCDVTAIDISSQLIQQAQVLDKQQNVSVDYHIGQAEEMDFAENSFDCVIAGQCWHWFERKKVASLVHKILKPGGSIVIAHFDWIPVSGNVVEATEKLILKHNPNWHLAGGAGVYPQWFRDIAEANFNNISSDTFDLDIPYSHIGWRGRIRASAGIGASLESKQVEKFDQELTSILQQKFPQNPLLILHRTFTLIAKK